MGAKATGTPEAANLRNPTMTPRATPAAPPVKTRHRPPSGLEDSAAGSKGQGKGTAVWDLPCAEEKDPPRLHPKPRRDRPADKRGR